MLYIKVTVILKETYKQIQICKVIKNFSGINLQYQALITHTVSFILVQFPIELSTANHLHIFTCLFCNMHRLSNKLHARLPLKTHIYKLYE